VYVFVGLEEQMSEATLGLVMLHIMALALTLALMGVIGCVGYLMYWGYQEDKAKRKQDELFSLRSTMHTLKSQIDLSNRNSSSSHYTRTSK
jgi:uncharacterized membrane protein YebE (DUF533 family)